MNWAWPGTEETDYCYNISAGKFDGDRPKDRIRITQIREVQIENLLRRIVRRHDTEQNPIFQKLKDLLGRALETGRRLYQAASKAGPSFDPGPQANY